MASITLGPLPPPATTQVCHNCRKELPLSAFDKKGQRQRGLMARCRMCRADIRAGLYLLHRSADSSLVKRCRFCHKDKPENDYVINRQTFDGLFRFCRECVAIKAKARRADPVRLERIKATERKRAYGLTSDQYKAMMALQHGGCAVCGEPPQKWCVDHDHVTGKVRGLLCNHCNAALGLFKDNPAALQSAIYYLALHDET